MSTTERIAYYDATIATCIQLRDAAQHSLVNSDRVPTYDKLIAQLQRSRNQLAQSVKKAS